MLEALNTEITKNEVSLHFVWELYRQHDMDKLAHVLALPLEAVLRFIDYKAKDIHYLLDFAEKLGITFGALPAWYDEAISQDEQAKLLRLLHCRFRHVWWPSYSAKPF